MTHPVESEIQFRVGTGADAADILALLHAAFAEYRAWLRPESGVFRESVSGLANRISNGVLLLALSHDTLVGCVLCTPLDTSLYFGRLAVHPNYRNRGIAKQLVAFAERVAIERNFATVTCAARIALVDNVRFFQSLGYVISAEKTHAGFDHPTYYQLTKSVRIALA